MPTTPSPYNYNTFRYRKVSSRAKKSGGGICGILALAMVAAPIAAIVTTTAYFV